MSTVANPSPSTDQNQGRNWVLVVAVVGWVLITAVAVLVVALCPK